VLPCLSADQQQIRNVGAGDEHYQRDGPHHYPQDVAHVADHLLLQQANRGPDSPVLVLSAVAVGSIRPVAILFPASSIRQRVR
jgi:hypothetical protein